MQFFFEIIPWEGLSVGLPNVEVCHMPRDNGEIIVKTKDHLRELSLGPPHAPVAFAYRANKHFMVVAGSSDGSLGEQLAFQFALV